MPLSASWPVLRAPPSAPGKLQEAVGRINPNKMAPSSRSRACAIGPKGHVTELVARPPRRDPHGMDAATGRRPNDGIWDAMMRGTHHGTPQRSPRMHPTPRESRAPASPAARRGSEPARETECCGAGGTLGSGIMACAPTEYIPSECRLGIRRISPSELPGTLNSTECKNACKIVGRSSSALRSCNLSKP